MKVCAIDLVLPIIINLLAKNYILGSPDPYRRIARKSPKL